MSRQQMLRQMLRLFTTIITNMYNPAYPQLLIDNFHTVRDSRYKPGLNIYDMPSLVWNPNDKFYQDQDLDSRFYYEYPKKRYNGLYNNVQMGIFLRDKPVGSSIYLVNLGSKSRIREYTIMNHLEVYRNRRCILLRPIGTY